MTVCGPSNPNRYYLLRCQRYFEIVAYQGAVLGVRALTIHTLRCKYLHFLSGCDIFKHLLRVFHFRALINIMSARNVFPRGNETPGHLRSLYLV